MSESEVKIRAEFPTETLAKQVESVFVELVDQDGTPFHEFIQSKGITKGIKFYDPSWWLPQKVEREGNIVRLELVGSPSGYCDEEPDREDDVLVWLRTCGAEKISGEMIIDCGGDVEVLEI